MREIMPEDWKPRVGWVFAFHGKKDAGDRVEFNRARPHTKYVWREKGRCHNTVPL